MIWQVQFRPSQETPQTDPSLIQMNIKQGRREAHSDVQEYSILIKIVLDLYDISFLV